MTLAALADSHGYQTPWSVSRYFENPRRNVAAIPYANPKLGLGKPYVQPRPSSPKVSKARKVVKLTEAKMAHIS